MKNIPKLGIVHTLLMSIVFFVSISTSNAQWVQTGGPNGVTTHCLAVRGTTLFAGTEGGGVFRSTDNGTTWTALNSDLINLHVYSLAVSGTTLFAGTEGGVLRSIDNGDTWTTANKGLTNSGVSSLAVSGTTLFAGKGDGIFRSTDNGTTWTAVNTGLTNFGVSCLAVNNTMLFVGTHGGGVFRSTDNGATWMAIGLANLHINSFAFSGATLFTGTNGGVFRSTDNGATWTEVNSGLKDLDVWSLTVSGTTLFAGMVGDVFRSTDNGATWMGTGLPHLAALSLAVSGSTLFAGAVGSFNGDAVWKLDISTSNVVEDAQPEAKGMVSVTAYPNPSSAITTISITLPSSSSSVEVFSIYGEKVFEASSLQSGDFTIDVSGFPNGVYSAVVTTADGSIGRTKLVVMK